MQDKLLTKTNNLFMECEHITSKLQSLNPIDNYRNKAKSSLSSQSRLSLIKKLKKLVKLKDKRDINN